MRCFAISACILSTLLFGCDEQLPSYEEPKDVLEGFLQKTTGDTATVVIDSLGNFVGSEPTRFRVYVRNKYFQLLEGTALIKGTVNLGAFVPSPRVASVTLSRSSFVAPPIFQQRITLPPGDSARMDVGWNHSVIGGYIYDSLQYTERYEGTTRIRTFSPISITADGEIQIFERVQAVSLKAITFTLIVQEFKLNAR